MNNKGAAPSFSAVESVLSEISVDQNMSFSPETEAIIAQILREASDCDSESCISAAMLVKATLLSFWSGFRAANAQREAEQLEKLIGK